MRMSMRNPRHRSQKIQYRESGIALVMALLTLFVLSLAVAGMVISSQQEVWTTSNFRATTQARYVAEAGVQAALQYLKQYTVTGVNTAYPPTLSTGSTLVLANFTGTLPTPSGTISTTADTNFSTSITNTMTKMSSLQGFPKASANVVAQLLMYNTSGKITSQWKISSSGSVNPYATVATIGRGNALVEEVVLLSATVTSGTPTLLPFPNSAIFANGTGCGALTITGGSSTNAYNSVGNIGKLSPPLINSSAPVMTFGNVKLDGSGYVLGNLFAPGYNLTDPAPETNIWWPTIKQPGVSGQAPSGQSYNFGDSCGTAGASNAQEWAANVTGGSGFDCTSTSAGNCKNDPQNMPATISVKKPDGTTSTVALSPSTFGALNNPATAYTCNGVSCSGTSANAVPTTFQSPATNKGTCTFGSNYSNPPVCAGGNGSGSPNGAVYGWYNPSITLPASDSDPNNIVNYGKVTLGAAVTVTLQAGTYYFDTLTVTGAAQLLLPATGKVVIYVKNDSGSSTPINFNGGTLSNPGGDPARMMLVYNGTQTVSVGSISNSPYFGTIYAPFANVNFYGNGSIYGAVIGNTVSVTGGGHVYFDTNLANAGSPGYGPPGPGLPGPPTWTVQQYSWTPW